MNYEEALAYIHQVDWRGSIPGLTRVRELLSLLGDPQKKLRFIHVAGTNGKGSTCAMLASVLQAAGYCTGLYISPFVNRFNERIQINNVPVSDDMLAEVTALVRDKAETMAEHPTEFELVTAIGFCCFLRARCDVVVLEVGLGGRLDATNVIDAPVLAVITNIGFDHEATLGNTLKKIAFEKAGIIKEGVPVVSYDDNPDADEVFTAVCAERHAHLTNVDFSRVKATAASLEQLRFSMTPYGELSCPLVGEYQLRNACTAITAIEQLRTLGFSVSDAQLRCGLADVRWPARFEVLSRAPVFILDGGHNPQGVAAAVSSLHLYFPGKKIVFLLGIMADKDVTEMLSLIAPLASCAVTVTPDNHRALPAGELADRLSARGCYTVAMPTIPEAVALCKALAGKDGVVCALGSLYMSGDVRACFPHHE